MRWRSIFWWLIIGDFEPIPYTCLGADHRHRLALHLPCAFTIRPIRSKMAMSLEVLLPCRPAEVGFGGKQGIFAFSSDS